MLFELGNKLEKDADITAAKDWEQFIDKPPLKSYKKVDS